MSPFPTPCKGKSMGEWLAFTFALTGRRRLCADNQGVALGCELAALSGRSFSRFVRLSCAHASPLVVWQKNAQRFFWILNTLPCRGAGPHNRLLRRQHCSSLCSQSEGHEHVANMTSAFGHDFVGFSARAWPPQYSPPSLCEQSELQCFAPGFRQMSGSLAERRLRRWLSEFVFLPLCLAGVSASLVEKTETNTIR